MPDAARAFFRKGGLARHGQSSSQTRPLSSPFRDDVCDRLRSRASLANPYHALETVEVDLETCPANFYCITAIIRPWRLPAVVAALSDAGIRGMTVTDVRGLGAQGGGIVNERDAGNEILGSLIEKTKVEVILSKDQVNYVVQLICTTCYTGSVGDGKIFVSPVADVVRVRTGETGAVAERMQDGLADKGYTSPV